MPPNALLRTTLKSRPSSLLPLIAGLRTRIPCRPSYSTTSTPETGDSPNPTTPENNPSKQTTSTVKTGTVVSAGLMRRTVRVLYKHSIFDKYLRKNFPTTTTYMVSDPRDSLREGDVIEFSSGWRSSKNVRHVVDRIVAPFGAAIEDRPAIMTREERVAESRRKAKEKAARKSLKEGEKAADSSSEREPKPYQRVGRIKTLIAKRLRYPAGEGLRKNVA